MMTAWILALALQVPPPPPDLQVEVRPGKGPDVQLTVRKEGQETTGVIGVSSRKTTFLFRDVGETWKNDSVALAQHDGKGLHADVKLGGPGLYDISLGSGRTRVGISRSSFKNWPQEIETLTRVARTLQGMAAEIEQTTAPTFNQVGKWRKLLQGERERVNLIQTEFWASRIALEDGISRLYFHRSLLKVRDPTEEEIKQGIERGGYDFDPATSIDKDPSPIGQVRVLLTLIRKEAAIKLLDEMALLFDKELATKVILWKGEEEGLREIAKAYEDLKEAHPEIDELITIARGKDEIERETLPAKIQALRAKLLRPDPSAHQPAPPPPKAPPRDKEKEK